MASYTTKQTDRGAKPTKKLSDVFGTMNLPSKVSLPASASSSSSSSSSKAVAASGFAPTPIQYGSLVNAQRAQLMTAAELAKLYGITYDRGEIEKIFQDATRTQFDALQNAYDRSSKDYYHRLAYAQDASLDTMRRANAVSSGASAGMQNATALSAVLGLQQTAAPDALELTQEFRALHDEYAAAVAENTKSSLEYANQVSQYLGTLASTLYGVDAQQYAAELGHNAQVQAANTAASAQAYASDQNLAATQYAAKLSASAASNAARYAAQAQTQSDFLAYNGQIIVAGINNQLSPAQMAEVMAAAYGTTGYTSAPKTTTTNKYTGGKAK